MFFLVYFIWFLQMHILYGHECTDDEVYFEESCYKLVKLKPLGATSTSCTNLIDSDASNECIEYLDKFIQRLIQIYKNNLKLNEMYSFGFLDFKSISHRSIIENILKNHEIKQMNIFMNYYFYNNNYYVENQPSDDEHPNVMMHGSNKGLKCIYGQRIHNLNESFSFYYDDCNKEFPFICVKPYHSSEYLSVNDSTDRCSYFDKVEPGGNWFECDKLDETGMSKSHKCCMYNVKWRENFNDANKLCRKFDSFVFSLRLKGYKVILEKYAAFLSTNYLNSKLYVKDLEFFSFWTSCKSLASDPDNLDRDDQVECVQKNPISMLASTLLQFTDVKGMKINALVNLANSTLRKNSYYNLTFVDLLLKSLKFKNTTDKRLKDCNDESFITSGNVIPKSSSLNLSECLDKLNRIFNTEAFYLGRRKLISYKLETIIYRINKKSNNLNETKCFHYSKFNDKHFLSIPILNKCYHFTISAFNSNTVNMTADDLKRFDYSAHPNYDIELDDLNPELISILMTTIGIADYKSCDSNVLLANNYSILIVKDMCFNLISLIKFVNKNDYYLNGLTRQLTDSQIYIRLHSYSHIKAILHLTCSDQVFKLREAIFRCLKFNDEKFCLFTCPVNCAESNDFGQVWQFSSRPFLYLNTSSICLAAIHSNLFQSNLTEFKLYLNRNNSNNGNFLMSKIKSNRVYSNLWPPVYIKNTSMLTTNIPFENGFYFERNTPNEIKDDIINNDAFIVIKAVYYINDEKSIITFMLYHDLQDEIKSTKFNFGKLLKFEKKMNISIEFSSEKAISFTFFSVNTSFLNNYYDVTFKSSLNKSYSIKFPINLVDFTNLKLPNEHTIRLSNNEKNPKSVRYLPKSKSKSRCKWHINSLTSGINCDIDLDLQMDSVLNINDIDNELNVIYAKNFTQDIKAFTRIILTKNDSLSLCKNGGIPSNSNLSQCLCLPGYFGLNCEKICKQNYFGNQCQFNCLENNCKGSLICGADPIGCSCAAGFKGFQCDETCSIGTWGPNCLFDCLNCKDCNIFTGDCDCAINKKGNQCDECNEGFYGKDCTEKCLDNCVKCDRINGTCLLFTNNTSRDCLLDYLNDCSIETNQYLVKEFKLNSTKDFSLICVLKYFDSNDICDDVFKETCGFISFVETKLKNQHSRKKCFNSSQYEDNDPIYLAEICSELLPFKLINQKLNWIGFLSRKFDCQKCSEIKLCNISSNNLNENQLMSNDKLSDFSFRVIAMWLTTFVLLLLFTFLFLQDKNKDESFLNDIENLTLPTKSYEI